VKVTPSADRRSVRLEDGSIADEDSATLGDSTELPEFEWASAQKNVDALDISLVRISDWLGVDCVPCDVLQPSTVLSVISH